MVYTFQVKSTLSHSQQNELSEKQFTFMDNQQISLIFGKEGLIDLDLPKHCGNWTKNSKEKLMKKLVKQIGEGKPIGDINLWPNVKRRREKRRPIPANLQPFIFAPDIAEVGQG